jgi:hypothetical protein
MHTTRSYQSATLPPEKRQKTHSSSPDFSSSLLVAPPPADHISLLCDDVLHHIASFLQPPALDASTVSTLFETCAALEHSEYLRMALAHAKTLRIARRSAVELADCAVAGWNRDWSLGDNHIRNHPYILTAASGWTPAKIRRFRFAQRVSYEERISMIPHFNALGLTVEVYPNDGRFGECWAAVWFNAERIGLSGAGFITHKPPVSVPAAPTPPAAITNLNRFLTGLAFASRAAIFISKKQRMVRMVSEWVLRAGREFSDQEYASIDKLVASLV